MRAMIDEAGPEIKQLVFEIRAGPEQGAIQTLPPYRSDHSHHKWMRPGNDGDGLDFGYVQHPSIGWPLPKL